MSWRMKSKSGWLADGKPTSISLKPISTTVSNMRRLRAGSIGSMRAWLPSRRSTEHHSGAFVIRWSGQVRSGSVEREERPVLVEGHPLRGHGFRGHQGFLVFGGRMGVGAKKNLLPSAGGRQGERREWSARLHKQEEVGGEGPGHVRPSSRRGPAPRQGG